ncbi:glutamate racemase [Vaginella massiliensis]|uniref:glutamate racemase n=1 Tax=Vaginella massiliensis TaxID=1816680 RepID=UPI0008390AAD|nr:glutamate racemase [Vaginella massiliensis]
MYDNRPIGVFDSGVGGLNFAKEIKRLLPQESLIYFGDTKHLPYGEKSPNTIKNYVKRITAFLKKENCKAILIACNSATANALDEIKEVAGDDILVVDVIKPVAEKVAFELRSKIGVIATKATVGSNFYKKSIRKYNKHIQVVEFATPLLVPVIEEGFCNTPISRSILEAYLKNKKLEGIDSLILGCTHYPLLEKEIEQVFEGKVQIIDSPLIVVNYLYHQLQQRQLLAQNEAPTYAFYLSDYTENFNRISKRFFGNKIALIEKNLDNILEAL